MPDEHVYRMADVVGFCGDGLTCDHDCVTRRICLPEEGDDSLLFNARGGACRASGDGPARLAFGALITLSVLALLALRRRL